MSFQSDLTGEALAGAWLAETAVKATLGALVGTFSLVKQFELNQRQTVIAENADARAQQYLALTQDSYANITKPIAALDTALFNRFVGSFANYQALYETEAFRLTTYTPDYVMQEGRAISMVQRQFEKAALQRKRQLGKYSTGRARYESVWFSTMTALAKVDAANHAYRFEEARKRYFDSWYWQRQTAGMQAVAHMEADAINALNKGSAVVAQGLNSIGQAEAGLLKTAENVESTLQARSNIWGGIANGAFNFTGYSLSESRAQGMVESAAHGGWNEPLNTWPITTFTPGFGSLMPNT